MKDQSDDNKPQNGTGAREFDSEKQIDSKKVEEAGENDQRQLRIQYRESRYNKEGIREEKDVKEDKDIHQASSTEEMQKAEASKPSIVLMKRYDEDGKYEESNIEVQDLHLNAMILFVLAHNPKYRHYSLGVRTVFYSPYEPLIHSWSTFEDLVSLDKDKTIWVELLRKLERPQESHNRQDLNQAGNLYALKDPEIMSTAIEDLKLLLTKIESSIELEEFLKLDEILPNLRARCRGISCGQFSRQES